MMMLHIIPNNNFVAVRAAKNRTWRNEYPPRRNQFPLPLGCALVVVTFRIFSWDTPIVHPVALLDRRELVLGKVLGIGTFCEVLEIKEIRIQYDIDSTDLSDLDSSMQRGLKLDDSEMQRQELGRNSKLSNGKTRYVLKQLSVEALFLPDDFVSASTDLIDEANYLLRLDHRKLV